MSKEKKGTKKPNKKSYRNNSFITFLVNQSKKGYFSFFQKNQKYFEVFSIFGQKKCPKKSKPRSTLGSKMKK